MELPRRARGPGAPALACVSRARKTMARCPRTHLPFSPNVVPRWEWHRYLDF